MPDFHYRNGVLHDEEALGGLVAKYGLKFTWFFQNGYHPHYWQTLFHTNTNPEADHLCRFRHLVAGRRGGKTMSAAWEVLYYCLHPSEFHWDAHKTQSIKPLHVWVLTKDYPTGMAALLTFREALAAAGLEHGKAYKENRGNRWFEFENGSFVQFKTADDPETLRGAGLDILWMDEAAFIGNERAWQVARPALSDKLGLVVSTTTPDGKNWFYDEFWSEASKKDVNQGRVEYRSIDNPYFPAEEWRYLLRHYHPLLFKQEYMASFDSMAGKELSGEWLHYYTLDDLPLKDRSRGLVPDNVDATIYVGVDPAISLADSADRFVLTVIAVTHDKRIFLLDQWAGRIPFPEQVDKINEYFLKWRPAYIAIEKVAYQAALAQQVQRLEGFPPVVPLIRKGKKSERILSMSPLFRIGRIRIQKEHIDFINEWLDYDSTKSNPKDDCLDSMEITLSVAGVLLPNLASAPSEPFMDLRDNSIDSLARRDLAKYANKDMAGVDEHLGADW
ncbi:MAG TPA: terminase family protein [Candidatus Paceibacterota bacterium]